MSLGDGSMDIHCIIPINFLSFPFFFQNKKFEEIIRFIFLKSYSGRCVRETLERGKWECKEQSGGYQSHLG